MRICRKQLDDICWKVVRFLISLCVTSFTIPATLTLAGEKK